MSSESPKDESEKKSKVDEEKPKDKEKPKDEEKPKVEEKPKDEDKSKVEEKPKDEEKPKVEEKHKDKDKPKVEDKPKSNEEKPKNENKPKVKAKEPKDETKPNSNEGSCSIDAEAKSGYDEDSEEGLEDSVEEYSGSTKDVTSGDKFRFMTAEEYEEAKRKRLRRRKQSKPKGLIGTIFEENGKWMEKCNVHMRVSMEVDHLIDVRQEMRNYVRPGGPYRLTRYACVDSGIPVCAEYADWFFDPELRYVKSYDIRPYRKRRIQRWLSEVLPIHQDERFDRYLVRCHSEAIKELNLNNQEFKSYQDKFPHIVDKWVAVLHLGMLFKRKNMGKTCYEDETALIIKLMREECEVLYFRTKIIFFEEHYERRNHSIVPKKHWILHPRNLCGDSPI